MLTQRASISPHAGYSSTSGEDGEEGVYDVILRRSRTDEVLGQVLDHEFLTFVFDVGCYESLAGACQKSSRGDSDIQYIRGEIESGITVH
jgi:hypothetical protein